MEEIKANEILRTSDGKLYKIVSATKDDFLCLEMRKNATKVELLSDLEPIVKHGFDRIDIVEKGDYVNGNIVYEVLDDLKEILTDKTTKRIHFITGHLIDNNKIESIVTHEQFEQMKYIVGDESNVKD